LIVLSLFAFSAGCTEGEYELETQHAFVTERAIWDSPIIPVCWENGAELEKERTVIRQSVAATWEAHSALEFVGWGFCENNSRGIRIELLRSPGASESYVGKRLDGVPSGMKLRVGCDPDTAECIARLRGSTVHEFGHAIGFQHEQHRVDTPRACNEKPRVDAGDMVIGPWDLDSVMNYCNPLWNGDGFLSQIDKYAVGAVYGEGNPKGLMIVSEVSDKCIDVADASTESGAKVQSWRCNGRTHQRWDLIPKLGGNHQVVSRASGKCLSIARNDVDDGVKVTQRKCSSSDLWRITPLDQYSFTLHSTQSGKCLDLLDHGQENGTDIVQWWCHGGSNQLWHLEE
jgi:hypothetical protein